MTVFELIEELRQYDPDSLVKVLVESDSEQYEAFDPCCVSDEYSVSDDLIGIVFIEVE